MKIIAYTTTDPEAPADARAVARIRCMMIGKGGKASMDWHPVVITAATSEAAEAAARRWWAAETERWGKLTAKGRQRAKSEAAAGEAHLPEFPDSPAPAAVEFEEEAV